MRVTVSQLKEIVKESLLKEASKRDAQGIGALVKEVIDAIVSKIKQVEDMHANLTLKDLSDDLLIKGNPLHQKIEQDIEKVFSNLKFEGDDILERARARTKNKNTIIFKISTLKIKPTFKKSMPPWPSNGLGIYSGGGAYSTVTNGVQIELSVEKCLSSIGNNYNFVNRLIESYQELFFHELQHTRQYTIDEPELALYDPEHASIIRKGSEILEKDPNELGLKDYSLLIKGFYKGIKKRLLTPESITPEDFYGKLEKYSKYLKDVKRLYPLKSQLAQFILSPISTLYNKYSDIGEGASTVFLVYYYFSDVEVDAYVTGIMRTSRLRTQKEISGDSRYKKKLANLTREEKTMENRSYLANNFYNDILAFKSNLHRISQKQIKDLYEAAFFFQKSSVNLEELLNKNTELCNVLAGLLFDHAIKKYGFFEELFEYEAQEVRKWRLSGGQKGMHPSGSTKLNMDRYVRLI